MDESSVRLKLRSLWGALLPDEPFDDATAFHQAGGNSLTLMRLFMQCTGAFGVRLDMARYPELQTIEQQARFIVTTRAEASHA
ncbi:acyl carrier protein [Pseudomonas entomophila]|uniref:acyl carrier protein n=1 Tax=Pseudomonas entomophila TaxID=312306 RepID=UPI0015E34017|nr:acyl carrier protein [Pseudomonas entomophila]MBA1189460.1 acyl carrier protein [Pseudomonas entomophila]